MATAEERIRPGIHWVEGPTGLGPVIIDERGRQTPVAWAPQPGSQEAFLSCPIFEALFEGTRGGGKTDTLIMDFCQHVGAGWGAEWRGILFRRTYPELEDVISKSKKWFGQIFPHAKYNEAKSVWTWPTGETLRFRHFKTADDYWSYHGHAYPWQGWEELTTWPTDECMKSMFSCARSSVKGIPIKIRATTNPYGVGHHWVKQRYRLPLGMNRVVGAVIRDSKDEGGTIEPPRVAIHSDIRENKILLFSDPGYIQRISASARNPSERAAWIYGSWDIVSGGIFQDVFDRYVHILPDILPILPASWRVDRSFDWGSSKPFSVGWWATSDGSDLDLPNGKKMRTIAGDVFRVAEWYGWDGKPNKGVYMTAAEIAMGIKEREARLFPRHKVRPGPADSSIFDSEDGHSVASGMSRLGVSWVRADKSAGSRKNGWERIRVLLKNAIPSEDGLPREEAALYVTERCDQWIRTVPSLQRDDKDLDDVDTESEDHIGDETRYRLYKGSSRLVKKTINGR